MHLQHLGTVEQSAREPPLPTSPAGRGTHASHQVPSPLCVWTAHQLIFVGLIQNPVVLSTKRAFQDDDVDDEQVRIKTVEGGYYC